MQTEETPLATTLDRLLELLKTNPEIIEFQDVMTTIAEHYNYTPVQFSNGAGEDLLINHAGENEGSCKIFAFAKLHGLSEEEALACFSKYYREDVLRHPEGKDHLNIRTFMKYGWHGIQFEAPPLNLKTDATS